MILTDGGGLENLDYLQFYSATPVLRDSSGNDSYNILTRSILDAGEHVSVNGDGRELKKDDGTSTAFSWTGSNLTCFMQLLADQGIRISDPMSVSGLPTSGAGLNRFEVYMDGNPNGPGTDVFLKVSGGP